MNQVPTYLKDAYAKSLNTKVKEITVDGGRQGFILEDTVFYPEGGGQPCDQGTITSEDGRVDVKEVKLVGSDIIHYGKVTGDVHEGAEVNCEIDWDRRYKNMIVHSAGHLVEEALFIMNLSPNLLKAVKGSHGKNAYVEYKVLGDIPSDLKSALTDKISQIIKSDLDISIEFVSGEEIAKKSRWVPPKLPENKPLRVVSIGDNVGIPDGGTLVMKTSEVGKVVIGELEKTDDTLKINYSVEIQPSTQKASGKKKTVEIEFPEIKDAYMQMRKDFSIKTDMSFSKLKTKYLGKKGLVKALLRTIGSKDKKFRADFGIQVHALEGRVRENLETLKKRETRQRQGKVLTEEQIDITAPFAANTPVKKMPKLISGSGTLHPITQIGEKALEIFETMGFHVTEARQLDNDYYVFEALNIPEGHPARDLWDTFWTEEGLIPITHTSAMQNRIMKNVPPPIREVVVGKCFRNEATDASHEHTFYQVEGIYVDKGITLTDLIGTLSEFMNAFYGKDVKYRIQPSYFPFVEPGLEFMVECLVCGQKGCPFCGYSGWIELVPCGPVHPNVLREGGLDPKEYSGFAWGLGFDRLVMLGAQIEDIRRIHCGDLNFLEQFK
ncbi:phenylalanine--tRNA ligase subunit alpha [Candidatus Dojkabacteria bacterium]|nr:phenylalanine--tRNA ligase subunit alpha [Candidatus Dojkabacteria bacterium]